MKSRIQHTLLALALLATFTTFYVAQPSTAFAAPLGTAFTYQGRLNDGANPATGIYDLRFAIYGAGSGGGAVAGPVTNSATPVTNGLFTVTVDFGSGVFTGPARWLQLDVRTNGGSAFTGLSPREPVLPMPYAIFANTASNLLGTLPATQLGGMVANSQLANNSITVTAGTGLTGGGTMALGGSTTLNNGGVLSVTGNADITASTLNGAVTLGDTATDANTAGAIVKRDASGNFSAGSVTLAGDLNLPTTTTSGNGIVYIGGQPILHAYGGLNVFVGRQAGNRYIDPHHGGDATRVEKADGGNEQRRNRQAGRQLHPERPGQHGQRQPGAAQQYQRRLQHGQWQPGALREYERQLQCGQRQPGAFQQHERQFQHGHWL